MERVFVPQGTDLTLNLTVDDGNGNTMALVVGDPDDYFITTFYRKSGEIVATYNSITDLPTQNPTNLANGQFVLKMLSSETNIEPGDIYFQIVLRNQSASATDDGYLDSITNGKYIFTITNTI